MLILVARYAFLFWLFIGGNNTEKLFLQQIIAADEDIFRLSSCTSRCLYAMPLSRMNSPQHHHQQPQQRYHKSNKEEKEQFTSPSNNNNSTMQRRRAFSLQQCFNKCQSESSTNSESPKTMRKIHENISLNLVCRDDRSLTFQLDFVRNDDNTAGDNLISEMSETSHEQNRTDNAFILDPSENLPKHREDDIVYFIRINKERDAEHYWVFLSDENFFTLGNLTHNTTYNVTAVAVHGDSTYSVIAKDQYRTLRRGYTPGKVFSLQVVNFTAMQGSTLEKRLKANIMWKPSADMTCHYNIICFSTESAEYDVAPLEIRNPRELYTYGIENLTFSKEYSVGIRAKNTNNESKESELFWITFRAPSCVEYYNYDFNICPPPEPEGLEVEKTYLKENEFALNISWHQPQYLPDYYTLRILDLAPDGQSYTKNLSKHQNTIFVENITLHGIMYEVHLVAHTTGGKSTAQVGDVTQVLVRYPDENHKVKLISAIFAPIFCIVLLSLTTFIICHRRAKLKRYQERCKYFEELEKKAPIDPKATFEFPTKTLPLLTSVDDMKQFQFDLDDKILLNDDAMEIERGDVMLYEVLGEGAFGLVRRGIFQNKKTATTQEVAVKMIKEQPSIDDLRAFRREIEVMKSVERHPNIVGIVGHCTKRCSEMLLLTEYCSLGNLLDFLRDEWRFLHESQQKAVLTQKLIVSTSLHSELNGKMTKSTNANIHLAAVNNSYGYEEFCTNACKCQVEIERNEQMDNNKDSHMNGGRKHSKSVTTLTEDVGLTNKIKIKECECKQRQQQKRLLLINNKRNAVDNKSYFKPSTYEEPGEQQKVNNANKNLPLQRMPLSGMDLLDIAKQVAVGMEYLAKNKVVHRDLAARNVLVAKDRTVKIADFGLSRDIYQENIYKKTGNGKLPIKWLALESLTHQVYTTQSDVWSYGILLYEIITLGETPYPSIATSRLLHLLKSGYRMEKPKTCSQEFYNLMASCWNASPGERPTFTGIIETLEKFMSGEEQEQQIETTIVAMSEPRKQKIIPTSNSMDAYLKPL